MRRSKERAAGSKDYRAAVAAVRADGRRLRVPGCIQGHMAASELYSPALLLPRR